MHFIIGFFLLVLTFALFPRTAYMFAIVGGCALLLAVGVSFAHYAGVF